MKIGCELLGPGSERGSAVRLRVWEMLLNWQFGKPDAGSRDSAPEQTEVQYIWNIPGPPRETQEP